jgi:hypothetical protein
MKTHPVAALCVLTSLVASPAMAQFIAVPQQSSALSPGLYVQVIDGSIKVSTPSGSQNLAAGQFGFTTALKTPAVLVPTTAAASFTPPPSLATSTASTSLASKSNGVDCEVR